MAIKFVDRVTVPLTWELAKQFAEMPRAPWERPVTAQRRSLLLDELKDGPKCLFVWVLIRVGDAVFRIDGQASAEIYYKRLLPIPGSEHGAQAAVTRFLGDTHDDAIALWLHYNPEIGVVTARDIINAVLSEDEELVPVPMRVKKAVFTGIKLQRHIGVKTTRIYAVAQLVLAEREYVLALDELVNELKKTKTPVPSRYLVTTLLRSPAQATMLSTFHLDRDMTLGFWRDVLLKAKPPSDHQRLLREYLLKTRVGCLCPTSPDATEPAKVMWERCMRVWNAWRNGEALTELPVPRGEIPLVV